MRKYIPNILIGILLVAVIIQAVFNDNLQGVNKELVEEVATEKQKVKERESDISILKIDKESLRAEKMQLLGDIDKLSVEIFKSKSIIEQIKKERDEKIKYVDDIPSGQLQGYFSKRYNRSQAK